MGARANDPGIQRWPLMSRELREKCTLPFVVVVIVIVVIVINVIVAVVVGRRKREWRK